MKERVVNKIDLNNRNTLVETDWLEENLGSPDLRVFDCTAIPGLNPDEEMRKQFPVSAGSGKENFDNGHIPGVGFIDVPGELSDKSSRTPMMMLPEKQFVDAITRYGITDNSHVVLYSLGPMWATRVWWMLRAYGFDNASVLNGGWKKWSAEERPVSNESCTYLPGAFTARPRRNVNGDVYSFMSGETIHTENSYKYSIEEFHNLAARAGFALIRVWTDGTGLFSIHYLTAVQMVTPGRAMYS